MKEAYREGLANHSDPESCGRTREGALEALTGAGVGRVLSREIPLVPGAYAVIGSERQHRTARHRECRLAWRGRSTPAHTETPCARTGRSHRHPAELLAWVARGRPEAVMW